MRRKTKIRTIPRFETLEKRALLASYRWLGGTFSSAGLYDWNVQANWFNEDLGQSGHGVPGEQDTARILGGTHLQLGSSVTVGTLIVGGDFRDQSHQIQTLGHTLTFGGGALDGGYWIGSFVNTGALTVNALTGANDWPLTMWGDLNNTGTIDFESGRIRTSFLGGGNVLGTTITNAAGAQIRIHDGASVTGDYPWAGAIENHGLIAKIGGEGPGSVGIPVTLHQGSELRAETGTLRVTGNNHRFEGGSIQVDAGGTLEFFLAFVGGTSTQINAPTTVTGPGTVRVRRGEIQLNSALNLSTDTTFLLESDDFAQSSRISGTGSLEAGTIDIRKGWLFFATLTNRGEVRFSGEGISESVLHGSTLINENRVVFDAPSIEIAGSGLTNTATGTIDIVRSGQLHFGIFGGAAFNFREWRNAGLIHQHAGVEGFSINSVQFINEGGTIRVDAGTFDLSANIGRNFAEIDEYTSRDATMIVAPGATLDWHLDGGFHGFGGTFNAIGGGTVLLGATVWAVADDLVLRGDPGMYVLRETSGWYGRVENHTNLVLESPNQSPVAFVGDFANYGNVVANTFMNLNIPFAAGTGRFFNMPGATLETAPHLWMLNGGFNSGLGSDDGPLIRNQGLIRFGGALTVFPKLDNLGTVEINGSTLFHGIRGVDLGDGRSGAPGTWIVREGGNLRAHPTFDAIAGTVRLEGPNSQMDAASLVRHITGSLVLNTDASLAFANPLTNSGRIELGPGSLLRAQGGFVQTASGTFATDIAASDRFGKLIVNQPAHIAGMLDARLAPGFSPGPALTFEVLTASSLSGAFTGLVSPGLIPAYTGTSVILGRNTFAGDLIVESVELVGVNGPLVPKQVFQLRYTVRNNSENTVVGPWSDIVHIDQGLVRGLGAIRVGVSGDTAMLAGNASTTITLDLVAPGAPGQWHAFVTADRRGVIPDLDRSNNIGRSSGSLTIELPVLAIGSEASIQLEPNETYAYALHVPAGAGPIDVASLFGVRDSGEIRVVRASVFAAGAGWAAYSQAHGAGRRALVELTDGVPGLYNVYVTSRAGGVVTTRADHATLAIHTFDGFNDIRRELHAGDTLTLTVRGSGFTAGTSFTLGGRLATQADVFDSNTAVVTFANLTPGDQLVLTARTGQQVATAPGAAFRVLAQSTDPMAALANWTVNVDMPRWTRPGWQVPVTVRFRNDSAVSQDSPLLFVSTDNGLFRFPSETLYLGGAISVLGVKSTGRADRYAAGETGSIELILTPTVQGNLVASNVVANVIPERTPAQAGLANAATQPIPLEQALFNALRPSTITTAAWNSAVLPNLKHIVGETNETFITALRHAANRLAPDAVETRDVGRLVAYLIRVADDFGAISQRFTRTAFGHGIENPFDIRIEFAANGDALLHFGFSTRTFSRNGDAFNAVSGDRGQLQTRIGGGWLLTEADGSRVAFRGDGQWEYLESNAGFRVTADYLGNRLIGFTDARGDMTRFTHDAHGNITSVTDPVGKVITYTFDNAGLRLVAVTNTEGLTSTIEYDPATSGPSAFGPTRVTGFDGVATNFTYDPWGRVARVTLGSGLEPIDVTYGAGAELGAVAIVDALGARTEILRGEFGNVTWSRDAAGRVVDFHFNRPGLVTGASDPLTRTYYERDALGNITSVLSSAGSHFGATYSGTSIRPTALIDSLGGRTEFAYEGRGLVAEQRQPDGLARTYTWNAFGQVETITYESGRAVALAYNSAGLLASREYSDGSRVEYFYDARRNLTRVEETAPGQSARVMTFAYDAADRLTEVADVHGRVVRYGYDGAGRRNLIEADGQTTEYAFNALGRLQSISLNGQVQVTYQYSAAGLVSLKTFATGAGSRYEYDAARRISRVEHFDAEGEVFDFQAYIYDANGQPARMQTPAGDWHYRHDALGQLIEVTLPDGSVREYSVDVLGNREGYTIDARNRYITATDGTQYEYDLDGNLTAATAPGGATTTSTYDGRGRLVMVNGPAGMVEYEYDPLGQRVAVIKDGVRSERLVDPLGGADGLVDVIAEFQNGARVAHYLVATSVEARTDGLGQSTFYHFDAIGNTVGLTDDAGALGGAYQYLPFGEVIAATGALTAANPFAFQGAWGGQAHGAGLIELRARFYDPVAGRFTQADPLGFGGGDTNAYRYAYNSPLVLIDPSGLRPIDDFTMLSGSIGPLNPGGGGGFGDDRGRGPGGDRGKGNDNKTDPNHVIPPLVIPPVIIILPNHPPWVGQNLDIVGSVGTGLVAIGGLLWTGARLLTPQGRIVAGIILVGTNLANADTPPNDGLDPLEIRRRRLNGEGGSGSSSTTQVVPSDPNDINGPGGYGEALYRQPGGTYGYVIRFQNKPEATAPAQEVFISQQLDSNLDWTTFQLRSFGWASRHFDVPAGLQSYFTRIEDPASNMVVEVSVNFNITNGALEWTFRSLDPISLDQPADPFAGFLPPDDDNGRGQGHVSYTVEPKPGATTGTRYDAQASIVFDTEEPLLTNVHSNSIDNTPPVSLVAALPAISAASFVVSWGGTDQGAGIQSYTVWVQEGDGPWHIWLEGTTAMSATYTGVEGQTYRFVSQARDNVNLIEAFRQEADTFTRVTTERPDPLLPRVLLVTVNDGSAQRSRVTGLTLTFNTIVSLDDGALVIRRANGFRPRVVIVSQDVLEGQSVVTLAFAGRRIRGGSLPDGRYVVSIRPRLVRTSDGQTLASPHGQPPNVMPLLRFHRLFGDMNGNGRIDRSDRKVARSALKAQGSIDPEQLNALDWNQNGRLDRFDAFQFRQRIRRCAQ